MHPKQDPLKRIARMDEDIRRLKLRASAPSVSSGDGSRVYAFAESKGWMDVGGLYLPCIRGFKDQSGGFTLAHRQVSSDIDLPGGLTHAWASIMCPEGEPGIYNVTYRGIVGGGDWVGTITATDPYFFIGRLYPPEINGPVGPYGGPDSPSFAPWFGSVGHWANTPLIPRSLSFGPAPSWYVDQSMLYGVGTDWGWWWGNALDSTTPDQCRSLGFGFIGVQPLNRDMSDYSGGPGGVMDGIGYITVEKIGDRGPDPILSDFSIYPSGGWPDPPEWL